MENASLQAVSAMGVPAATDSNRLGMRRWPTCAGP